jgi:hypothetical protein
MRAGHHLNVAAMTAVAAAGTAARDVFLAPECQAAIAAIARFDRNNDFVYEHLGELEMKKGGLHAAFW